MTITKPIVWNAGALYLQPRDLWIIAVQAPTEIKPQYIYELNTNDDLQSDLIPLAVDHRINHKCPKLSNIPILSMAHIPKSTIFGILKPVEIENAAISETSKVLDYCLLNKPINAAHNGTKVISYYPLPKNRLSSKVMQF